MPFTSYCAGVQARAYGSSGYAIGPWGNTVCNKTEQSGVQMYIQLYCTRWQQLPVLSTSSQSNCFGVNYNIRSITLYVAPAAPIGLSTIAVTSTEVTLNWTVPSPANGLIAYYTLQFTNSTGTIILAMNTTSNASTDSVTGLIPCTLYSIAVSATTECADCTGPLSSSLTVFTSVNSARFDH